MRKLLIASAASLALVSATRSFAAVYITEVDAAGSATSTYKNDWFELTNTGSSAVDLTGWTMDDNSNAFGSSVPLRNVASIAPGQSVVFIEGKADGSTDATLTANFIQAWFGGTAPAGFTIGVYGGSGVGLSQTVDAVNVFDSTGAVQARVDFGVTTLGATLDNAALLNDVVISTSSVAGTNGAFSDGVEVGSPGVIANAAVVPEPASLALLAPATLALARRRRA